MAHWSLNFDRTGFTADVNVLFPIDRLEELAADGVIGGVAPRHLSFMGALHDTLSTIRLDTGPAAAKLLRDDGVGVVLLTGA
jgi:D-proline reductase (dithiol) PrdB